MKQGITGAEANLMLVESIIPAGEKLYIWCYRNDGTYIASRCPSHLVHPFEKAFIELGAMEKAKETVRLGKHVPVLIGSAVGMQWAVTLETERNRDCFFVIGPVFYSAPDPDQLKTALHNEAPGYRNLAWIDALCSSLADAPVMSYSVFSRYTVLLHNTLNGVQESLEILQDGQNPVPVPDEKPVTKRNRMQVRKNEQVLLQMVREGNINYHDALQSSADISPGVPVHGRDPLRQMKTSIIVFITLVTRAAMDGGLSPEIAYPLGDSYIQNTEDCRDSGELGKLAHAMYHDFICRVHYARSNPDYSHAVQKCCDYIELHTDQKLSAADLAQLVGYTEYYLTDKFKKETGVSLSTYIRSKKISRAKILLETTSLPISEISEKLAFNTPNYFIQCFRNAEGCTPAQYRKKTKNH